MRFLFALILLTQSGCMLATLGAFQQNHDMTPEQITAFRDANMDVYGCISVMGPPPAGGVTWIVLPKGTDAPISFLPGCMIQMMR